MRRPLLIALVGALLVVACGQSFETAPGDTTPPDTKPAETTPAETNPVVTSPVDTTPVDTTPVVTTPVETNPVVTTPVDTTPATGCAHVIDGTATFSGQGMFSFSATVASADTGWEKYADAWDVVDEDGHVLGTRELAHPHETEQPFTRSLGAIAIPDGVSKITLRAHDSIAGYCGDTFELTLDRS